VVLGVVPASAEPLGEDEVRRLGGCHRSRLECVGPVKRVWTHPLATKQSQNAKPKLALRAVDLLFWILM
jgi:hypothetical protein